MTRLLAPALVLCMACATVRPTSTDPEILVQSSNSSKVDVYLLCGERDAEWLGSVDAKGAAAYQIPAARLRCAAGLNFFLVERPANKGYWVGPMHPDSWSVVQLSIDYYAGLSTAHVRRMPR